MEIHKLYLLETRESAFKAIGFERIWLFLPWHFMLDVHESSTSQWPTPQKQRLLLASPQPQGFRSRDAGTLPAPRLSGLGSSSCLGHYNLSVARSTVACPCLACYSYLQLISEGEHKPTMLYHRHPWPMARVLRKQQNARGLHVSLRSSIYYLCTDPKADL